MTASDTQEYYDRFATNYEAERHHGYHRLIDELELVRRHGAGKDIFEAGCGTCLLLQHAEKVGRAAVGLDLSRAAGSPRRARAACASCRARGPMSRCPDNGVFFDRN